VLSPPGEYSPLRLHVFNGLPRHQRIGGFRAAMAALRIVIPFGSSAACSPWLGGLASSAAFQADRKLVRTQDWRLRSYLELGARPAAVQVARRHAKNILDEWRMGALADTVELLVSEIITNAVRASARLSHRQHEAGQAPGALPVRLWLTSDRHRVMIQVWDGDHHQPTPLNAGLDAEAGRGLLLVETLSAQWGCYAPDGPGGKIVWAVCEY
jgi:anti-sigma regulatory factor (Ser/Thr protein kinase)